MTTSIRLLPLLTLVACSSSPPGTMQSDLSGGTPRDLAQALSQDLAQTGSPNDMLPSDKQVCDDACAALINCGVLYDATCSPNCQTKAPVFLACARGAANDCKALALCSFQQFSTTSCGGSAGIPQGAGTCRAQRDCNGRCIDLHAPASCYCACSAALAASLALNALIDDQCSNTRCTGSCMVSAAACNTCQQQNCAAQSAQCANN